METRCDSLYRTPFLRISQIYSRGIRTIENREYARVISPQLNFSSLSLASDRRIRSMRHPGDVIPVRFESREIKRRRKYLLSVLSRRLFQKRSNVNTLFGVDLCSSLRRARFNRSTVCRSKRQRINDNNSYIKCEMFFLPPPLSLLR